MAHITDASYVQYTFIVNEPQNHLPQHTFIYIMSCLTWHSGVDLDWMTSIQGLMFPIFFYLPDNQNSVFLRPAYIDGLVQDCSNSIANALELL